MCSFLCVYPGATEGKEELTTHAMGHPGFSEVMMMILRAAFPSAGSTDCVCYSTVGTNDAKTSALHIIVGGSRSAATHLAGSARRGPRPNPAALCARPVLQLPRGRVAAPHLRLAPALKRGPSKA